MIEAADAALLALDLGNAIGLYLEALALCPRSMGLGSTAAERLARAYCERGDFGLAQHWIKVSVETYRDELCGVYQSSRERSAEKYSRLWSMALLPFDEAERQLRRVMTREDPSIECKLEMAREAALVLAEMLVREGRGEEARPLLETLAADQAGFSWYNIHPWLARARLRRL